MAKNSGRSHILEILFVPMRDRLGLGAECETYFMGIAALAGYAIVGDEQEIENN